MPQKNKYKHIAKDLNDSNKKQVYPYIPKYDNI